MFASRSVHWTVSNRFDDHPTLTESFLTFSPMTPIWVLGKHKRRRTAVQRSLQNRTGQSGGREYLVAVCEWRLGEWPPIGGWRNNSCGNNFYVFNSNKMYVFFKHQYWKHPPSQYIQTRGSVRKFSQHQMGRILFAALGSGLDFFAPRKLANPAGRGGAKLIWIPWKSESTTPAKSIPSMINNMLF